MRHGSDSEGFGMVLGIGGGCGWMNCAGLRGGVWVVVRQGDNDLSFISMAKHWVRFMTLTGA